MSAQEGPHLPPPNESIITDIVNGKRNSTWIPNKEDEYGLERDINGMDAIPVWTAQPNEDNIQQICTKFAARFLVPAQPSDVKISALGAGAFNQVFLVEVKLRTASTQKAQANFGLLCLIREHQYVFRVSLPVNPYSKTMSEYATLAYLRQYTTAPVARVLDMDVRNREKGRFDLEWMIQTLMPGCALEDN